MPEILIAPNSFKECMDSAGLTHLFHEALQDELLNRYKTKDFRFIDKPVSDGGDGFLQVCIENFNLKKVELKVSAPFQDDSISTCYGYSRENKSVYIESADVLGMKLIPEEKRHPLKLSSRGLGEMLLHLKNEKISGEMDIERVIIGIGGTGTSDFGIGMCSALGLKLLDGSGKELNAVPENFLLTEEIIWVNPGLNFNIEIVLDVDAPLLGEKGAARIFAPQKGATPHEVERLEKGLENIVRILGKKKNTGDLLGAGGGLAGGLHFFLDGKYKFARDFLKEDLGLNKNKLNPDLIITGEGSFDSQSMMQKGAFLVIDEFMPSGALQFICAGIIKQIPQELKKENIKFIEISKFFHTPEESMRNIEKGVRLASEEILKFYFRNKT
ncbi:MAG: glycerate kinase [Bacteroidota bacterium]|jgi:glycerate kinase|nr:glycerate kinase [Ignavibacteria bacterium]MCU7497911.1 glycerate kinase [Ignavibacteria bacterium]MCU7511192.1 glycerate kinase [Ignavibacteria bacterium]MCU7518738.1 glycerate kinase [Ignavibacteria bacterium]MCU7522859.1 glycerate kinase [Ignavibacteria bacterium]